MSVILSESRFRESSWGESELLTYRHPRTLADAFPEERADSGDWVRMRDATMRRAGEACVTWFCAAGIVAVLVLIVLESTGVLRAGVSR